MSVFLQPIYTQTVGAGGVSAITFNNIPQTFTDLKLVVSARSASTSTSASTDGLALRINNNISNTYSWTYAYGTGSAAGSSRSNSIYSSLVGYIPGNTATASTFGNNEIYIPNYISGIYKSFIVDSVAENNGTETLLALVAGLWQSSSAISRLDVLVTSGANFVQYSTFSLYGVLRQGI